MMLYTMFDAGYAAAAPFRMMANAFSLFDISAPGFDFGRAGSAAGRVMRSAITRRGKPEWDLKPVTVGNVVYPIQIETVAAKPFCRLQRIGPVVERDAPKLLLFAPLSGHHATLLRNTVQELVRDHDLYVTDWIDARQVPVEQGEFGFDDYVGYLVDFMKLLSPDLHVMAVCQPAPLLLAAVALIAEEDVAQPRSMILMGGPIDTRAAPTSVTVLAEQRPISWFERNLITTVPAWYPGRFRRVYPGFLQLGAFLSMNPDRHMNAHMEMFRHLVVGDGEAASARQRFYDEYLAVMDVTAAYYLQTVRIVFQEQRLARGTLIWRGRQVRPAAIRETSLLTVEGELDDISAPGQTLAAHALCSGIPAERQHNLLQAGVGHYGIFSGRKWRSDVCPRITEFIRAA